MLSSPSGQFLTNRGLPGSGNRSGLAGKECMY